MTTPVITAIVDPIVLDDPRLDVRRHLRAMGVTRLIVLAREENLVRLLDDEVRNPAR